MHRDEIVGSQEFISTSDDDTQNASAKDDDESMTIMTNGDDDDMSQGPGTPAKKVKKRKDGSEKGSIKKQKKIDTAVLPQW
jgi:hypothetical protein